MLVVMDPHASMANCAAAATPGAPSADQVDWVVALIHSRQTVLPKRLLAPGPDATQLAAIVSAAAAAPDHRQLTPWRFVIVPEGQRGRLAEVFATSLRERDPQATPEQLAQACEKAYRAPLLMLAIGRLSGGDPEIDAGERLVSAGCAIQNMLLTAHALGFGAALTSGKALGSQGLRALFALSEKEQALCFISIGTVRERRPARARPAPEAYVTVLGAG